MKKQKKRPANVPAKKGITYGKKRFRIIDPVALTISVVLVAITATLAVISNQTGFDKVWYGDLLTTADCIICFFALLNIGYVLLAGICVENGIAFLGTDKEKQPILFEVAQLSGITLLDEDGDPLPEDSRRWTNATIRFTLQDGSTREYTALLLTQAKYRSILTYFENRSH